MGAKLPGSERSSGQADERLLVEAAQKDPVRFGDLYEMHFDVVYAFVAKRVADRDAAEDVTSEVFHRALANLKHFEWRGAPFGAWLVRIAANAVADRGKRTSREVVGIEDPDEIAATPGLAEAGEQGEIFRLVNDLPEEQQRVLRLRFAEDKSIREIAQELGKTEGAIKQLQFRGVETLRERCQADQPLKAAQKITRAKVVSRKPGGKNG